MQTTHTAPCVMCHVHVAYIPVHSSTFKHSLMHTDTLYMHADTLYMHTSTLYMHTDILDVPTDTLSMHTGTLYVHTDTVHAHGQPIHAHKHYTCTQTLYMHTDTLDMHTDSVHTQIAHLQIHSMFMLLHGWICPCSRALSLVHTGCTPGSSCSRVCPCTLTNAGARWLALSKVHLSSQGFVTVLAKH